MSYQPHRGDALTVMKTLLDESVNAVITDPLYSSNERIGRYACGKLGTSSGVHDGKTFPDEDRDPFSWLTEVLAEAYRASTEHSVAMMIFSDWREKPDISDALRAAGWAWQGTIAWIKPVSQPRKGGFEQSADFITWGVKGSLDNNCDLYLPGHFTTTQPGKDQDHATQKPLEIMQQLVQSAPKAALSSTPSPATARSASPPCAKADVSSESKPARTTPTSPNDACAPG